MRYSSRREAIMEIMRNTKRHPDAEWVYARVREQIPSVSLGTVYRNLRELSAAGVLTTVETDGGCMHFDADTSPHAHFVCRVCGQITDLPLHDDGAPWTAQGYTVDSVKTVVYGTCPHCASLARRNLS